MPKSHLVRSSLAATLLAGSLCTGPGCASAPQPVEGPPPSPIPCPKGAARTYKLHHIGWAVGSVYFEPAANGLGVVRKGEVLRVVLLDTWGNLPVNTPLLGRTWFGKDRVYGRLTQVLLPSGESLPICADLIVTPEPGIAIRPGSTPTATYLNPSAWAKIVPESLKE